MRISDIRMTEEFKSLFSKRTDNIESLLNLYLQKTQQRELLLQGETSESHSQISQIKENAQFHQQNIEELSVKRQGTYAELLHITRREQETQRSMRGGYQDIQVSEKTLQLQEQLSECELHIQRETGAIHLYLQPYLFSANTNIQQLTSELQGLRTTETELHQEQQRINSQIEGLLKRQKEGLICALKEIQQGITLCVLVETKNQIETTTAAVDEAEESLVLFNTNAADSLLRIEHEESVLRDQQLAIKNSLKQLESPTDWSSLEDSLDELPTLSGIRLEGVTPSEKSFFHKALPLLQGAYLYKKFSQRNSSKVFDPLNASKDPPEACGFGPRLFRLSASLSCIEISHPSKGGVESSVPVVQILAPLIPQQTMCILNLQKKLSSAEVKAPCRVYDMKVFEDMRESRVFDASNIVFQKRSKECVFYPFSIVLEQGGRIEVISQGYSRFRQWITGINALVQFRKTLHILKKRVEK